MNKTQNLRNVSLLLALFIALTACSNTRHTTRDAGRANEHHAAREHSTLVGSWQLVSEEIRFGDQSFPTFDPEKQKMMKIFNGSHFAFLSTGDERPRFSSYQLTDEEKIKAFDNFGGGGGRYTFEDGYLTEHVEYMHYPNYEGFSIKFKVTMDGDTMIQEGHYPIADMGLGPANGYLYSVFKRIK